MASDRTVIGLVPAAGCARRLPPTPCSKEIYPINFALGDSGPSVAAHSLLRRMRQGGATYAYIVLRDGKWDIPAFLRSGRAVDLPLGYLMMEEPYGVPFTLNQAYPFVQESTVIMGFPDILFQPSTAYARLLGRQKKTGADMVLGLFPARRPAKMDMVEFEESGQVRSIIIKPDETSLQYAWIIATWRPAFTEYLSRYTNKILEKRRVDSSPRRETYIGHVIQEAIRDGLNVESVVFPEGSYFDIGTPDALAEALQAREPEWFA